MSLFDREIVSTEYAPEWETVRRTWRERLFSKPWRPWQATKRVRFVREMRHLLVMHPSTVGRDEMSDTTDKLISERAVMRIIDKYFLAPGDRAFEKWEKATQGKRTARRRVLCQDRNDANRYFNIVFFDSYESAMENSNLPETQAAAAKYMELSDGQPVFYDLDVIEDRS